MLAGLLGSLVGLGGGIIVVPALTLLMGVDIRFAIGASIISVIATSSGAGFSYVREHITNLRLAMFLEVATAAGALSGTAIAALVGGRWLFVLFGAVLTYTAWSMLRAGQRKAEVALPSKDTWADRLKLHGSYFDHSENREVTYRVARSPVGFLVSYAAGVISGLLGIGGGVLKVPVMNLSMGIPIKVCTATSNFMIGITAATSALVYFLRGHVQPFIAAPVAVGVLLGARIGAHLLGRLRSQSIRWVFLGVLIVSAIQMFLKGVL